MLKYKLRLSISFMALEKKLQTKTGVKYDQCLFMQSVHDKTSYN